MREIKSSSSERSNPTVGNVDVVQRSKHRQVTFLTYSFFLIRQSLLQYTASSGDYGRPGFGLIRSFYYGKVATLRTAETQLRAVDYGP